MSALSSDCAGACFLRAVSHVHACYHFFGYRQKPLNVRRPPLAPQAHGVVTASCWPQVHMATNALARANWAALWAAVGRSDTALILHMHHRSRDHYTLVHAAR